MWNSLNTKLIQYLCQMNYLKAKRDIEFFKRNLYSQKLIFLTKASVSAEGPQSTAEVLQREGKWNSSWAYNYQRKLRVTHVNK